MFLGVVIVMNDISGSVDNQKLILFVTKNLHIQKRNNGFLFLQYIYVKKFLSQTEDNHLWKLNELREIQEYFDIYYLY